MYKQITQIVYTALMVTVCGATDNENGGSQNVIFVVFRRIHH